jgi:hypothetical protein
VLLIGNRVEKSANPGTVILKPKISRCQDRFILSAALKQVSQDTDEVTSLLRIGRDQHLIFKELQKVRCKWPRFAEIPPLSLVLGRWDVEQPEKLGDVDSNEAFDSRWRNLNPVLEQPMQQHSAAVVLDTLGTTTSLKIDLHRIHPMDLLIGIGIAVPNRHDQRKEIGVFLGNLRQDLDEVERPVFPRILLGVGQAIKPSLKLIKQKHGRRMAQKLQYELI